MTKQREVVLPSGRFASVNAIKWGDFVHCYDSNIMSMTAKLAARVVLIDGNQLSVEEIMDLDAEEFFPINEILCKSITDAMRFKGGIA